MSLNHPTILRKQLNMEKEFDVDDRPFGQELRRKLGNVDSVTLISFRDATIGIHFRSRAKDKVLDVLRNHGLEIKRIRIP